MASKNFTWIFPPLSEPSSSHAFLAINNTQSPPGFGSDAYHVKDVIELRFDAGEIDAEHPPTILHYCSENPNLNGTAPQNLPIPAGFVLENNDPIQMTLALEGARDGHDVETCVLSYLNESQDAQQHEANAAVVFFGCSEWNRVPPTHECGG
ncbi:hypothetical protein K491DRAFT_674283 [Lophiostoma macrostomum CBS 122681]|uniref:Uncharacterized protein n=1 Tax=Lophiostoma macrostomum CBS 122681 TaxID=1314788 RepID=A0A6A6TND4_9PLEO|nr:hypothetical protein K491DRAFT_674283 [Lophiostoma macrostomum CBS 122681]